MEREAWLNGKLEGYALIMMPAAHALVQAQTDLRKFAADLSDAELIARPNNAPSVAFHLRHIAGSIDRLLTYSRGENLDETQFDFLKSETAETSDLTATELTQNAIDQINVALEALKTADLNDLYAERFVGRQKLPTTVFGLLFHIAEHTARHVGQVVTTAKIVKDKSNTLAGIQNWYQSYCDGYWEHEYGISIDTLDNPGWRVKIDLIGTKLEIKEFQEIKFNDSDDDWIFCKVENSKFIGASDSQKLEKILQIFLEWSRS